MFYRCIVDENASDSSSYSGTLETAMPRALCIVGLILLFVTMSRAQLPIPNSPSPASINTQLARSAGTPRERRTLDWDAAANPDTLRLLGAGAAPASPNIVDPNEDSICGITHLVRCIEDLAEDDKGIFTSPLRSKPKDAYWLIPLGAATGLAFAYDRNAERAAGVNIKRTNAANTIADFGSFYATGTDGAAIYFLGLARNNSKLAETGRLAAEAVIDSGTVTVATKLIANRQRPLQGDGQGHFWANGTRNWQFDSSFPSDHAGASMALARVVAGEYPHWYVVLPAYGFAETVSISRILANQHFPSDIVVGQAIGFLTGAYVLNHRARYRPGHRSLTAMLLSTAMPITNAQTRTFGASVQVPFTGFGSVDR